MIRAISGIAERNLSKVLENSIALLSVQYNRQIGLELSISILGIINNDLNECSYKIDRWFNSVLLLLKL